MSQCAIGGRQLTRDLFGRCPWRQRAFS